MSYISKKSVSDSGSPKRIADMTAAPAFSDQRASTAVQLKQQGMMHSAHSPNSIQRLSTQEGEPLQGKFESEAPVQQQEATAETPNNTGLPDNLKSGIENFSGYSMDDVKVHFNSDKPAQLNAHAYAQGTDIHVAPGQEQHLPHEAWHVVQQKQGRVTAAIQRQAWSRENAGLDGKQSNVDWQVANIHGDVVGVAMDANPLGPEHLQGGPPKSGAQKNLMSNLVTDPKQSNENKYIRGHLLNDNLGGPGEPFNLFPITANANKEHEAVIESQVKKWVNVDKQWVRYQVKVDSITYPPFGGINSIFKCQASVLDPANHLTPINTISANITSEYKQSHATDTTNAQDLGVRAQKGTNATNYLPLESLSKGNRDYQFTDKLFNILKGYCSDSLYKQGIYKPEQVIRGFHKLSGIGEGTIKAFVTFAEDALQYDNQPQTLTSSEKSNLTRINKKENEIEQNFNTFIEEDISTLLLNKWNF